MIFKFLISSFWNDMAGDAGVEPATEGLESSVLPLN